MIYRFGDYSLDTAIFELRRADDRVAVEPQVFNLLQYLIKNRDKVVSRDDIINAVWDGRAISDTTLSSRIFAARRAVGDTGDTQAIIRTVPRRGFRFIGNVSSENEECAVPMTGGPKKFELEDPDAAGDPAANRAVKVVVMDGNPAGSTMMPRLAVLPFKNLSNDFDEYFSDGLTEDIIANLTHFRELRVVAPGSSFQFKTRDITLARLAAELNVDYIVNGSLRRAGGRMRITVQLMDAATDESLWAGQYDREIESIFAVQDEVTQMIAASLGVKMQDAALVRAMRKRPSELDAYDCALHARRYTSSLSAKMHAEARDYLEKAISIDPNYADAYALLSNVYLAEHRFETNPRPEPVARALEMAQTATHLDPQNAYAHCWLAIVHFFRGENDKFEAESQRALNLNPNDPEILADIGHYLAFMGEFERGFDLSMRARQLNPLHPGWYHFTSARYHYHHHAYQDVLADVERISMPDFYWTHLLNTAALGQLGRPEANASLKMAQKLKPGFSAPAELRKWNAAPDDFAHIMDGLYKAGLKE